MSEDKINEFKADYLAKLVPFVLLTALAAGMTLDRVFKSLATRPTASSNKSGDG
jgi:hypothetical protein